VAFSDKMLNDGEQLVLDLRPHLIFLAPSGGAFAVAIIGSIVGLTVLEVDLMNWVYLLAVLGTGLWFLFEWVKWYTTNFVLTTDRIITSEGFIAKKGMEIPLDRVNTVIFNQSVFERMVGAGDLGIESAGEQGNQHLSDIRKPAIVKNEIYRQIEANENRKFDRIRNGPGADPTQVQAAPASIPDQIDQLAELHQRGVLSDAEFQRKKAELLDRM
jgi:uncharacterized membrane protein YdbT with pleckstrin-like domain